MLLRKALCFILLATAAGACNCGTETLQRNGSTTLTIDSPMDNSDSAPMDEVDFHATAHNNAGVKEVTLTIGKEDTPVATCTPTDDPRAVECDAKFVPNDHKDQWVQSQITLFAQALDAKGNINKAQVTINIRSLSVVFVQPEDSTTGDPAVANVTGPSKVALEVKHVTPLQRVQVTYDGTNLLVNFPSPGEGTSFIQNIDWATKMGTGLHHLLAQAMDEQGNVSSAKLDVNVACSKDADCPSGQRCCENQGTCNPIVGPGEDCDCEHPCPLDQGCFPGTCGQSPRKCRPGCFPGDDNHVAESCLAEDGHTAYCTNLPESDATTQNRGGACAPSDDCDVVKQDCPDLPLDRTKPVSATNPAVPHTCMPASPASPRANQCIPAGSIGENERLGQCSISCGNDTTNCIKGRVCVSPVDAQGTVHTNQASCVRQCAHPYTGSGFPSQAPDCASGEYCGGITGAGRQAFATGVCQSF